jgi:Pheromone A receptor
MSRDPALSSSQTFRLIALSILLAIPASVWVVGVYQQVAFVGFKPLPSWDVIHEHYNVVAKLKAGKITTQHRNSLLMRWWSILTDGYLVFALFGTSRDVIMEYHKMWLWFKTAVLKYPPPVPEKDLKLKKLYTNSSEYVVY